MCISDVSQSYFMPCPDYIKTLLLQLCECFSKLFSPPVSSYLHVVVNQSMTYPAITICRYPSYKPDILQVHYFSILVSIFGLCYNTLPSTKGKWNLLEELWYGIIYQPVQMALAITAASVTRRMSKWFTYLTVEVLRWVWGMYFETV